MSLTYIPIPFPEADLFKANELRALTASKIVWLGLSELKGSIDRTTATNVKPPFVAILKYCGPASKYCKSVETVSHVFISKNVRYLNSR
jgi:hypothetical protein